MTKYIPIALLLLVTLAGCGEGDADNPERVLPPSQEQLDAQIAKVKADPNMSEQAKSAAIAGIEMRRKMNDQGGDANKGFGKPK